MLMADDFFDLYDAIMKCLEHGETPSPFASMMDARSSPR